MTLSVVDRILVLHNGVVEAFGPRAEILPRLGARAMAQRPMQKIGAGQASVVALAPPPMQRSPILKGDKYERANRRQW
jgi:ABC-type protease/lipase transport system fused ATPase/permease subunit